MDTPLKTPDIEKMRDAVALFLEAAGISASGSDLLSDTPRLVADAWAGEFLDGYGKDPLALLREGMSVDGGDGGGSAQAVAIRDIDFTGVCPHHLLPWRGKAHVAYVPDGKVVGFGAIVQSVEALAHRLTIQERLVRDVAQALRDGLNAKAAFVAMEAVQPCLCLRGERKPDAVTVSSFLCVRDGMGPDDARRLESTLRSALSK